MNDTFKSGFISIIGRTNVGKSTLMNRLIGEKIAIMSNKPQTTRNRIQTVLTTDTYQAVFIDTPGIHTPQNKLGEMMIKTANTTLNEVDIIFYLVEPHPIIGKNEATIIEKLKSVHTPIFLCINKIDSVSKEEVAETINKYKEELDFSEIIPISAYEGANIDALLKCIEKYLPEGPQFFPDDVLTDQPERQIVAELIREKALHLLDKEIPHGIAVEIDTMKSRKNGDIVDIEATIVCERDSHKRIIIGKQGAMIKEIGSKARYDMERLLGSKVYLTLWVKVKKNWRDSQFLLKNYGFNDQDF
ncbi:GTPase Era [Zhenhengia yiwuensis]|jgi:GTP-binding protein Era|uniref:GTPase Era n=1 Tax=Zhenhengia yiwuensis TaxID=2763666 RepID=A0A926IDX2_9FIRM|nr:GTPase Era [Zhenhengia yiwuensis]MBC8579324.1 GTPase Era [Zhenhengia yiwuensis]MBS5798237.1 GTPase Era [Clostridiales bacterium]